MNLKEAYSILEIPQTSTPEEAKKKYRELTKKYHPDVNKDTGAEDKFKKINEAYQVVSSGKSTDREDVQWQHSSGFKQTGNFNPFGRQHVVFQDNIELHTAISFKESILGCKKDLQFARHAKCKECDGHGEINLNNGCDKCGGQGRFLKRQSGMVFIQTCDKCMGRSQTDICKNCSRDGFVDAEASINVTIPGGVSNGSILRLIGMGHYMGSFGPLEQHTDAHLHITVKPDPELSLAGKDVVFNLSIPLLDALKGCSRNVKTINGSAQVDIKPLSRNKDEIILSGMGVNGSGVQRVILDVKYPSDTAKLIDALIEEK